MKKQRFWKRKKAPASFVCETKAFVYIVIVFVVQRNERKQC